MALLVLGGGFLAMFAGVSWFWLVWVLGFAVLLPLVAIAVGGGEAADDHAESPGDDDETDALEELKRRYARGELDEEAFERGLERLLETEDRGTARECLDRQRHRERDAE